MIAFAEVVKRNTDDGVEFFHEDVPIGACYLANLDTRGQISWLDKVTGKTVVRDSILIVGKYSDSNPGKALGFVPVELLAISELKVGT